MSTLDRLKEMTQKQFECQLEIIELLPKLTIEEAIEYQKWFMKNEMHKKITDTMMKQQSMMFGRRPDESFIK